MRSTVMVTGGASGLGRVIAETLLQRGRRVVLVDRDEAALLVTARALGSEHGEAPGQVVADLASIDGVRAAAAAASIADPLVGLVNNAGGWLPGDQYPDAPLDAWGSALTLNLIAPMLLTQLLWPRLAAAAGAVVNVGSSGGNGDGAYGSPEYGAAKAGLRRFTASLGGREDVRVTAVVPGWIGLDRAKAEWAAMSPRQRGDAGPLIPPERVASVVADLLEAGHPGEIVELLGISGDGAVSTASAPGDQD